MCITFNISYEYTMCFVAYAIVSIIIREQPKNVTRALKVSPNLSFLACLAHFFKLLASLNLFFCLESVAVFSKWPSIVEAVSVQFAALWPYRVRIYRRIPFSSRDKPSALTAFY